MKYHEAADLYPLDEKNLGDLSKDIKENGQIIAIELLDGEILDGRRRYLACKMGGIKPKFFDVKVVDPIQRVVSLNEKRRHLTTSQLSIVAGKATKLRKKFDKAAKERQKRKPVDSVKAGRPAQKRRQSRDDIGKEFNISGRSAERGIAVVEKGTPEMVEAVEKGEINITPADDLVRKFPKEQQNKELQRVKENKSTDKKSRKGRLETKGVSQFYGGDKPVIDSKRHKAMVASANVIDYLRRSPLSNIGKSNPYRAEAFKKVISWLRDTMKDA